MTLTARRAARRDGDIMAPAIEQDPRKCRVTDPSGPVKRTNGEDLVSTRAKRK